MNMNMNMNLVTVGDGLVINLNYLAAIEAGPTGHTVNSTVHLMGGQSFVVPVAKDELVDFIKSCFKD